MCASLGRTASDWAVHAWAVAYEGLCIVHLVELRVCLDACFQGCLVKIPVLAEVEIVL